MTVTYTLEEQINLYNCRYTIQLNNWIEIHLSCLPYYQSVYGYWHWHQHDQV